MELSNSGEADTQGTIAAERRAGRGRCPIENPAVTPIPNDPLREPHPAEPGVESDGSASPLENPDDPDEPLLPPTDDPLRLASAEIGQR
jgi:hypothetical protein